ncbi:MAG TPA: acyl carrier protein [Pseudonocardiaceae bacterium]|nr:acyl carrier protein [Pseudonocardiaceae bacterium]
MADRQLLTEITGMLAALTGAEAVPADAALEGDLGLDSLDVAELAVRLRERYGVDLVGVLATLEVDRLVDLTAADLAEHVAAVAA